MHVYSYLVFFQCDISVVDREIKQHATNIVQKYGFKDFRLTSAKDGYEVDAIFETIVSLVRLSSLFINA